MFTTAAAHIPVERLQWRNSSRDVLTRGSKRLPPSRSSRKDGGKVPRLCARAQSPQRQHERQQALQLPLPQLADGPKAQEPRVRGTLRIFGYMAARQHGLPQFEMLCICTCNASHLPTVMPCQSLATWLPEAHCPCKHSSANGASSVRIWSDDVD